MLSIIPEREVLRAYTDVNISSSAARQRVNAFNEANRLLAQGFPVEIVIEGILFGMISPRLNDEHKKVFRLLYDVNESAVGVEGYNVTRAIKFIAEAKVELPKRKVIIITENVQNYIDLCSSNNDVRAFTPREYIKRIQYLFRILKDYDSYRSALNTVFFILPTDVINSCVPDESSQSESEE